MKRNSIHLSNIESFKLRACQQSVHPTLGILARFQAFFYASAFSQSDGFAVTHPSAGNANRWVAQEQSKSKTKYVFDSQVCFLA
jgi:hypothetical protein